MPATTRRAFSAALLPALAGIAAVGCAGGPPVRLPGRLDLGGATPDAEPFRIRLADGGIARLAVDDYVGGSVAAEAALRGLDPAAARTVAEVQALVARTWAIANRQRHAGEGFDLCATTHCQVYRPLSDQPAPIARLVRGAAQATGGLVIAYAARPINAVFHADCGGHTSDAASVWRGASPPYLQGLPDTFCTRAGAAPWRAEIDIPDLRRALNRGDATRVGGRLDGLEITEQDGAGRAVRVTLRGAQTVTVRGEQLRRAVNASLGYRTIRSTRFTVLREGRAFVFTGRGFGHGVGLCQTGAMARARAGHSPRGILTHYYPGAAVTDWRSLSAA